MFKIGDLVTRKSYNNDLVFRIDDIIDDVYILSGINIRLCADSYEDDLVKYEKDIDREEDYIDDSFKLERDDYFYLPGKILHIDSDDDYLDRCLNYYQKVNIWAKGILKKEYEVPSVIYDLLEEYKPDIVVITGHDAYYHKSDLNDIDSYKNSSFYVEAIIALSCN
jgi:spore coat assembly protein